MREPKARDDEDAKSEHGRLESRAARPGRAAHPYTRQACPESGQGHLACLQLDCELPEELLGLAEPGATVASDVLGENWPFEPEEPRARRRPKPAPSTSAAPTAHKPQTPTHIDDARPLCPGSPLDCEPAELRGLVERLLFENDLQRQVIRAMRAEARAAEGLVSRD